jgi:phosphatidylserine/phosphatidylglycerophosphate/cardiolipin synthase-like enzyme
MLDLPSRQVMPCYFSMSRLSLVALLTVLCAAHLPAQEHGPFQPSRVEVWFSPRGGCTEACETAINAAQRSIHVQAYSFTSAPIARALVSALKRGVSVEVILDKSQRTERYSSADFLAHAGVATFIDGKHAIAHNKIIVIDSHTVLTGSFNFTKGAEEANAENLLVLHDPKLAACYLRNWQDHRAHAEPYAGRDGR